MPLLLILREFFLESFRIMFLNKRMFVVKRFVVVLFVLLAVATTGTVYWNSVHNDFVNMDDLDLIVRNGSIKELTLENIKAIFTPGVVGAYQPVRTLSYAVDYHFWKLNPIGYHLTNIACHALSVCLVFLLIRAFGQPDFLAGVAALLFGPRPVAEDVRRDDGAE